MPYTFANYIASGEITTAKDFLKMCTREFGVMAEFSNETGHVEIPGFTYGPAIEYYKRRLEGEKELLEKYKSMTPEMISEENERLYRDELESRKIAYDHAIEINRRYYDILCKIQKWHPDEQYLVLKEHAIEQLNQARPNLKEYEEALKIEKLPDEEWLRELLVDAERAIKRYEQKILDEEQRCAEQSKWHQGLIESLEAFEE